MVMSVQSDLRFAISEIFELNVFLVVTTVILRVKELTMRALYWANIIG